MTTIKHVTEEKIKLKSLIRFHSANKINNYNRGGGREREKNIQNNLQNKFKHKNNKYVSWVTALRVPSLTGSHSPPYLPRMPDAHLWTCYGVSLHSKLVLLLCVLASNIHSYQNYWVFFFCGSSQWPYIYSLDTVCLVDCADLICNLYSWWEGFGSSSLGTLPLGFSCGFVSTSACGLPTGACSWGCPCGLGFSPLKVRCRSGAAA